MAFVGFESELLPFETQEEILEREKEILPDNAEILLLSFTGSRAFGWGSKSYDIDIRLVAYIPGEYWDTFHDGKYWDVNGETFKHFKNCVKRNYWTTFEDMYYAFYLHPSWDHDEFLSLCSIKNVKHHLFTIRTQVVKAKMTRDTRTALHAYRLTMSPLHFLRTGELMPNVRNINYLSDYVDILADAYAIHRSPDVDWDSVIAELDFLYEELLNEVKKHKEPDNSERMNNWFKKIEDSIGEDKYDQ